MNNDRVDCITKHSILYIFIYIQNNDLAVATALSMSEFKVLESVWKTTISSAVCPPQKFEINSIFEFEVVGNSSSTDLYANR